MSLLLLGHFGELRGYALAPRLAAEYGELPAIDGDGPVFARVVDAEHFTPAGVSHAHASAGICTGSLAVSVRIGRVAAKKLAPARITDATKFHPAMERPRIGKG